jgi:transcriptional regulator with XRE-family HTH domain
MTFNDQQMTRIRSQFTLREGIGDRIREVRLHLGKTQGELARQLGINRVTQASYESGLTEPGVSYLLGIQQAGGDLAYVLFGETVDAIERRIPGPDAPNWKLVRMCREEVELFFARRTMNCPDRYQWEITKRLYEKLCSEPLYAESKSEGVGSTQYEQLVHEIWLSLYERADSAKTSPSVNAA